VKRSLRSVTLQDHRWLGRTEWNSRALLLPRALLQALSKSGSVLGTNHLRVLPSKTAIVPVSQDFMPRSMDEVGWGDLLAREAQGSTVTPLGLYQLWVLLAPYGPDSAWDSAWARAWACSMMTHVELPRLAATDWLGLVLDEQPAPGQLVSVDQAGRMG
jgi:hypothetical protein